MVIPELSIGNALVCSIVLVKLDHFYLNRCKFLSKNQIILLVIENGMNVSYATSNNPVIITNTELDLKFRANHILAITISLMSKEKPDDARYSITSHCCGRIDVINAGKLQ